MLDSQDYRFNLFGSAPGGTPAMRELWSTPHRHRLWRQLWLVLAEVLRNLEVFTPERVEELRDAVAALDGAEADREPAEVLARSEVVAEAHRLVAQSATPANALFLEGTSGDIEENAHVLLVRKSCERVLDWLRQLLGVLVSQIERWADVECIAFLHLQPAEPTTVGYRLAMYAQDLLTDLRELTRLRDALRGKGLKGRVGTADFYISGLQALPVKAFTAEQLEAEFMRRIELPAFLISGRVHPRKQDWLVGSVLASLALSLEKMAADVRLMQAPFLGEWQLAAPRPDLIESVFTPYSENPADLDRITSLSRTTRHLTNILWDNAASMTLEYSGDEYAIRREIIPALFRTAEEMLLAAQRSLRALTLDLVEVQNNLDRYGMFSALGRLHWELVRRGADSAQLRTALRHHTLTALNEIADGSPNPLVDTLCADNLIRDHLTGEQVRALLNVAQHQGDAVARARRMADEIRDALSKT